MTSFHIAFLTVGFSLAAHAQGTVNFSAGATTLSRISTNQVAGGPSTGYISAPAGSYYFALFVAPTSVGTNAIPWSSLDPTQYGFTFFDAYGTNTGALGRFTGNPTTDGVPVPNYPTGSSANFVVVGWSATVAGADWSSFLQWWNNGGVSSTGWAGRSLISDSTQLGGGMMAPGGLFGAGPGDIPGFVLGRMDPTMVLSDPTKLANGNFQFTICGPSGWPYRVWGSTNIYLRPVTDRWTLLGSGTLGAGSTVFTDSAAQNFENRFYILSSP